MNVFNEEIAYRRDRILFVMAGVMCIGALIGFISFLITQNFITKALLILFTFSMFFHGALYFLYTLLTKFQSMHFFTVLIYFIFTMIALYNPFGLHYMWVYLLYIPIFIGLIENERVYYGWSLLYIALYAIFLFFNHGGTDRENSLFMIVQILLAADSILVGSIIVKYLSFVRGLYIQNHENQIKEHVFKVLSVLIPIVESKAHTTKNEMVEMSELMKDVAKKLPKLNVKDWEIELLSLLHFVSRIEWPDYLFEKHDALSEYECKIVQNHCLFGSQLLGEFNSFANIKEAFLNHHQRKDGTGYPDAGTVNPVPALAQILGIVETYLEMIYPRAYHSPKSKEDALVQIQESEKTRFDPQILDAFAEVVRDRGTGSVSQK
jgi:hypothetical protein